MEVAAVVIETVMEAALPIPYRMVPYPRLCQGTTLPNVIAAKAAAVSTAQNVGRPILAEFVLQVNDIVERFPLELRSVSEERGCRKPLCNLRALREPVVELETVDWDSLPLPDELLQLTAPPHGLHGHHLQP